MKKRGASASPWVEKEEGEEASAGTSSTDRQRRRRRRSRLDKERRCIKGASRRRRWPLVANVFGSSMNATMLLLNLAYVGSASVEAVEYVSGGVCTADQQRDILEAVTGCQARETLVDLREHMPNVSNVIQVIPDFATVNRCGGSCDLYSHRCVPTATTTKRLEVMVVLSQFPNVQTETQCGYVEVDEHVGCRCDCPVQAHHCRADQYYEQSSCRCLCQDQTQRNACILSGMQWDPVNCMCICPMASWRVCSTGYIFDFTQSCQCVPTSTTASMGLLVAVIVLMSCLVVTAAGGVIMYKKQLGVFRPRSRRNTIAAVKAGSKCASGAASRVTSRAGSPGAAARSLEIIEELMRDDGAKDVP